MSSDHYATLGVSPSAESAAIRAAYRRLMRHYHPDANPDPEAHKRAQSITAAYSVLRNPAKRARYDEERRDADIWRWVGLPPRSARPAAARSAGIAASVLAILMVGAVLMFVPREQPASDADEADFTAKPSAVSSPPTRTPVELQSESERLAALTEDSSPAPSPIAPPPKPVDDLVTEPPPVPAESGLPEQAAGKLSKPPIAATRRVVPVAATKPFAKAQPAAAAPVATPKAVAEAPKAVPAPAPADAARVASLQRISSGFYDQSLANADTAKKQQLLNVRVRETYQRAACRSDSCVADSYLRQIRDVGAIMQNRAPPPK